MQPSDGWWSAGILSPKRIQAYVPRPRFPNHLLAQTTFACSLARSAMLHQKVQKGLQSSRRKKILHQISLRPTISLLQYECRKERQISTIPLSNSRMRYLDSPDTPKKPAHLDIFVSGNNTHTGNAVQPDDQRYAQQS